MAKWFDVTNYKWLIIGSKLWKRPYAEKRLRSVVTVEADLAAENTTGRTLAFSACLSPVGYLLQWDREEPRCRSLIISSHCVLKKATAPSVCAPSSACQFECICQHGWANNVRLCERVCLWVCVICEEWGGGGGARSVIDGDSPQIYRSQKTVA